MKSHLRKKILAKKESSLTAATEVSNDEIETATQNSTDDDNKIDPFEEFKALRDKILAKAEKFKSEMLSDGIKLIELAKKVDPSNFSEQQKIAFSLCEKVITDIENGVEFNEKYVIDLFMQNEFLHSKITEFNDVLFGFSSQFEKKEPGFTNHESEENVSKKENLDVITEDPGHEIAKVLPVKKVKSSPKKASKSESKKGSKASPKKTSKK